jgi:hypothetical protein
MVGKEGKQEIHWGRATSGNGERQGWGLGKGDFAQLHCLCFCWPVAVFTVKNAFWKFGVTVFLGINCVLSLAQTVAQWRLLAQLCLLAQWVYLHQLST